MAKGYSGGMPGSMNNLVKQAQKMQKQMEKLQEELSEKTLDVTSGGGAVKVTMTYRKDLKAIKINPEVLDPDDVEMLEDLILTALNEALRQADEAYNEQMSGLTGGINMPGLF